MNNQAAVFNQAPVSTPVLHTVDAVAREDMTFGTADEIVATVIEEDPPRVCCREVHFENISLDLHDPATGWQTILSPRLRLASPNEQPRPLAFVAVVQKQLSE